MLDVFKEHRTLAWWLFALSLVFSIAGTVAVPWLLVRIPADFFVRPPKPFDDRRGAHIVGRLVVKILKNAAGVLFLIVGVLMLFTPGQGLLGIAVGLALLDFPRKRELQLRVLRQPMLLRSINRLRVRAGKPPLVIE